MRKTSILFALSTTWLAAGCVSPGGEEPIGPGVGTMLCEASAAQGFKGQKASVQTGTVILDVSGARELRWGPPDSAWTMDYRTDRVNVRYDKDMVITEISCG